MTNSPNTTSVGDFAELRELAEKATPGPWEVCQHLKSVECDDACPCGYRGVIFGPEHDVAMAICQPGHDPAPAGQEGLEPGRYPRAVEIANSQFIAAANPSRILSLLSELAALKARVEEGEGLLPGDYILRKRHGKWMGDVVGHTTHSGGWGHPEDAARSIHRTFLKEQSNG